jgi:hypothetical protein
MKQRTGRSAAAVSALLLVWIINLLARVSELERELKKAESWWERASQPRERL